MDENEVQKIEVDLFLRAIYERYGYDFRNYTEATIKRRVKHLLAQTGERRVSDMIPELLHDQDYFHNIVQYFSITVTEMFRDPEFYKSLRQNVIPYLKTYPFIKIWHAGCATGEEAYSLAIILKEEGLYDRATIFATDFNDLALEKARQGIYPLSYIRSYTANYQKSGGKESFGEYYHAQYDSVILDQALKERITFANHNLVTDGVFGQMHLILCRNVLIYFNRDLQDYVIRLFHESLVRNGFLGLGTKESLRFLEGNKKFRPIDLNVKIYQKR